MAQTLLIAGAAACFRRPEIVDDLISYDAITPIAARKLFEMVHWTPAIQWHVERIEVLHPIRTEWKIVPGGVRSLYLVDVLYAVRARFELATDVADGEHPGKHAEIFRRRARRQQFARPPHLGRRGLPAQLRQVEADEVPTSFYAGSGTVDLGWMVHDRAAVDPAVMRYYRPLMIDGVIDLSLVDDDVVVS